MPVLQLILLAASDCVFFLSSLVGVFDDGSTRPPEDYTEDYVFVSYSPSNCDLSERTLQKCYTALG